MSAVKGGIYNFAPFSAGLVCVEYPCFNRICFKYVPLPELRRLL